MSGIDFYLIIYKVRIFGGYDYVANAVISENPTEFLKRNLEYLEEHKNHMRGAHKIVVLQWAEISEEQYNNLKDHNTTSESYARFKERDYGRDKKIRAMI